MSASLLMILALAGPPDTMLVTPAWLSARLGQAGLRWQQWARGDEMRPLVPAGATEQFEEALDLLVARTPDRPQPDRRAGQGAA